MLDSLLLLDADPEIAKPVATLRVIKTEINHKTPLIINDLLKEKSDDFKKQYNAGEYNTDIYNFNKHIVDSVGEYIKKTYPSLPNKFQTEILSDLEKSLE